MSRIPALAPADAGPLVRLGYRMARKRFEEVPEPFAVMAQHRKLFVASARHELAVQKATKVMPPALIQLAVFRTAWPSSPSGLSRDRPGTTCNGGRRALTRALIR